MDRAILDFAQVITWVRLLAGPMESSDRAGGSLRGGGQGGSLHPGSISIAIFPKC
jgi:hypothetical protein